MSGSGYSLLNDEGSELFRVRSKGDRQVELTVGGTHGGTVSVEDAKVLRRLLSFAIDDADGKTVESGLHPFHPTPRPRR